MSLRVSQLCLRSAWLQKANVLAAQGKEEEARKSYQSILPLLVDEPRCSRIDWERVSLRVNIGNTYARTGDFHSADEQYELAEKIGMEHLNHEHGSREDGELMVSTVKRARAFALAKNGREAEAKVIIRELIDKKLSEEKKKKVQASDTQNENIITIKE
jgi:tetratricopeptide (TPR) repeat protein